MRLFGQSCREDFSFWIVAALLVNLRIAVLDWAKGEGRLGR
jgi:hypothetical protein